MDVNLILFKKDGSQKTFPMPSDLTVIGRRQDCDLCIPLMSVSRKHCQIIVNNDTLKIRDLKSRNGTYLNGKRIDEATAKSGDYLKIGSLTFLLQIDGQPKKIVPPEMPPQKPPKKGKPQPEAKTVAEQDSFAELEFDESDSGLTELEDL